MDYGSSSGRPTSAEDIASAEAADGEFYVGDAANITLLQCWQRVDYWCGTRGRGFPDCIYGPGGACT